VEDVATIGELGSDDLSEVVSEVGEMNETETPIGVQIDMDFPILPMAGRDCKFLPKLGEAFGTGEWNSAKRGQDERGSVDHD
jgi:hypothetical protein